MAKKKLVDMDAPELLLEILRELKKILKELKKNV